MMRQVADADYRNCRIYSVCAWLSNGIRVRVYCWILATWCGLCYTSFFAHFQKVGHFVFVVRVQESRHDQGELLELDRFGNI